MFKKLEELFNKVENKKIFVLTGAGMSTESGIPDFRSSAGIKTQIPIEVVLSAPYFYEHTEEFYKIYKKFFLLNVKPNKGHYLLAELESKGLISCIATQNIDGLHTTAGSKKVWELHGTIKKNYCLNCKAVYKDNYIAKYPETVPLCSKCGGIIKPDVVLYGEGIKYFDETYENFRKSNIIIVLGSSLAVYPAAGFGKVGLHQKLIIINYDKTPFDKKADVVINESISTTLKTMKNILLVKS